MTRQFPLTITDQVPERLPVSSCGRSPGRSISGGHQPRTAATCVRPAWADPRGAVCVELDHWIRRKVRTAYWRQWRRPRTKARNLMARGVRVQAAVACGTTSKGPWRSSKTPGINQVLSDGYLKSKGLFALRDDWVKLHCTK